MKNNHTHKYVRTELSPTYLVYKCVLPNCTHYLPTKLVIGRMSICWNCGVPFQIVARGTRPLKKKFICDNCWEQKNRKDDKIKEMIGNL